MVSEKVQFILTIFSVITHCNIPEKPGRLTGNKIPDLAKIPQKP